VPYLQERVVPVVVASDEHEMNVSSEEAWADFRSIRTPPHANSSSVLNAASSSCGINTFAGYDEESGQITRDRKYYGGIFPLVSQRGIITIGGKSIMESEFIDLDDSELAQQSTNSEEEVEENEDHLIYGTSRVSRSKILDAPIEEGEDNVFLE
jgi:hypothetical protein